MWPREYIESLTLRVAYPDFNERAIGELVFCLRAPDQSVPQNIASTIQGSPKFWDLQNPFPGRLAYGVLSEAFSFLDYSQQKVIVRAYQRQINRITLHLLKVEEESQMTLSGPKKIMEKFSEHFNDLQLVGTAALQLAERESICGGEIAALLEKIVENTLRIPDVTKQLIIRVSRRLSKHEKQRLVTRTVTSLEEGYNNEPIDLEEQIVKLDISEVRFSKAFFEDSALKGSAEHLSSWLQKTM